MKGPGLRLLIDVRRTWKCPRCGYEEHVGAQVTTVPCPCCPGVNMRLCEQRQVYGDQLQRLRTRRTLQLEAAEIEVDGLPLVEIQANESVETPSSGLESSPTDGNAPPPKRRGKRPHKQSRRGQIKQQADATKPPADSEE